MKSMQKPFYLLMVLALLAGLLSLQPAKPVQAANTLRISQVYGGGGLDGATYTHDFIEIFNSGSSSVSLAGMSIQYASGTGAGNLGATTSQLTELPDLMLGAGQYYLIQGASGSIGAPLPLTPDLTDSTPIDSSGYAGKVALVNSQDSLGCNGGTTPCDAGQLALIVDLIGYGITNFYEGSGSAPLLSSSTSALRVDGGCTDADDNSDDFEIGSPVPRNTSSSTNICNLGDQPPTVASTVPANGAETVAVNADITITFSEPVTVADGWYRISCGTSNTYTAAVDPANPVFTLNPAPDFTAGETCTVTIFANKVNDDDNLDEDTANYMLADHSFSFSITEGCVGDYTPIYDIQGSGLESPFVGETVTTEGVVVGDFQTEEIGKDGFFIQDITGDTYSTTSDGIFIYNPGGLDVNVGDEVRLTGLVNEYYDLTQIKNLSNLQLCSTGNTITPTPVSLPVTAVDDFEKVEGMLVTFEQPLIISEYFNFDRYGEIVLTSERHMTPTAFVEPGPDAVAAAQDYLLDRITLDDGRTNQNPDPAIHPNGDTFDMDNLFRGGGTVTDVTGVMDYDYDLYRLQLTEGGTYVDANPRPTEPQIIDSDLKIASFNVLNYFVTLDDGSNICGPSGTLGCRGADDIDEFNRQKNKIVAAMTAIDADIYGLMEIENDSPVSGKDAVADLVAGINAIAGTGTYAYIQTGAIGTDAIKQAILYKPASVTPVGAYQVLDSMVDSRFIDTKNRPVLAQVFEDNDTGEKFVVAVNHLKSKGSPCDDIGDPDLGDGAGNCNLTRLAAAQALMDWLAVPSNFPDAEKKLIIGDLNSYDKEDPVDAIKAGADDELGTADDYLDMIYEIQGENAYSYVFDGQTGYLDHALANQIMAESIVDVEIWHINADEPDLIDYDTSFKKDAQDDLYVPDAYRSSDHDPVIVTIERNYAPTAVGQSVTTTEDIAIDITLTGTDPDGDTLSYAIVDQPTYGTVNLVGALATYTPTADYTGPDSFTFKAFDGSIYSAPATVSITVNKLEGAPDLDQIEDAIIFELVEFSFTATANDASESAQGLTFSLSGTAPDGAVIDSSTGVFSWTPSEEQGPGVYTFKVIVCDDTDPTPLCDDQEVTLTVTEVNVSPVLDPIGPQSGDEGTQITFTAAAADVDLPAQVLTFSLTGTVPEGAEIDPSTGEFTWTPTEAQGPGEFTFTVQVCDDADPALCDYEEITVTVNEVNLGPELGAIGPQSGDEDSLITFTATATDADLPAQVLTFSLVGATEDALIETSTGEFTWTPADPGVYTFTVQVCDDAVVPLCDIEEITVTVYAVAPDVFTIFLPLIMK